VLNSAVRHEDLFGMEISSTHS